MPKKPTSGTSRSGSARSGKAVTAAVQSSAVVSAVPNIAVNGKQVGFYGMPRGTSPARQRILAVSAAGSAQGLTPSERKSLVSYLSKSGTGRVR